MAHALLKAHDRSVEGNLWTTIVLLLNRLLPRPGRRCNNMKINYSRKAGFTLVEIMIVVAIIALLAAIAIPNFVKARASSQISACVANLKQLEGAKATWAMEMKKANSDTPSDSDLFGSTLYIREKPQCPANGTYDLTQVDAKPTCTMSTEGHTL